MSVFTDAYAAIDEAQYLADMTGYPQCIISEGGYMTVVTRHDCIGYLPLETIHPAEIDAEAA